LPLIPLALLDSQYAETASVLPVVAERDEVSESRRSSAGFDALR
jgi:hypothetical protein